MARQKALAEAPDQDGPSLFLWGSALAASLLAHAATGAALAPLLDAARPPNQATEISFAGPSAGADLLPQTVSPITVPQSSSVPAAETVQTGRAESLAPSREAREPVALSPTGSRNTQEAERLAPAAPTQAGEPADALPALAPETLAAAPVAAGPAGRLAPDLDAERMRSPPAASAAGARDAEALGAVVPARADVPAASPLALPALPSPAGGALSGGTRGRLAALSDATRQGQPSNPVPTAKTSTGAVLQAAAEASVPPSSAGAAVAAPERTPAVALPSLRGPAAAASAAVTRVAAAQPAPASGVAAPTTERAEPLGSLAADIQERALPVPADTTRLPAKAGEGDTEQVAVLTPLRPAVEPSPWESATFLARSYGGEPCFAVMPVEMDGAVGLVGFGVGAAAMQRLEDAAGSLARRPAAGFSGLSPAQCEAVDFFRRSVPDSSFSVALRIDTPRVEDHGTVEGEISRPAGTPVWLVLVDDEGRVERIGRLDADDGDGSVRFPVSLTDGAVATEQLLMAIAGDVVPGEGDAGRREPADAFFSALRKRIEETGARPDIAIAAFRVVPAGGG
jgi:hypothetical protein